MQLSHDTLHEGRFALAIATHKCDLVASLHGEVHTAEDGFAVERHRHVAHLHRVAATAWTGRKLQAEVACVLLVHLDEFGESNMEALETQVQATQEKENAVTKQNVFSCLYGQAQIIK